MVSDSPTPASGPANQPRPAARSSADHPLAGTITIGTPTRGITLRRWWIVGAAVFVVLFLGVNLLYARSTQTPELPTLNSPERLTVFVNPYGIIPAEETIKTRINLAPPASLVTANGLSQSLTVLLLNEDKTLTFAKGDTSLSSDVLMVAYEASYEKYPLDEYALPVQVMASTTDAAGVTTELPGEVVVWGKFPGWRVIATTSEDGMTAEGDTAVQDDTAQGDTATGEADGFDELAVAYVDVSRNGSTMSIVVLLLISMIVLSVIALVVARAVSVRKRRIEATMASWFAALLFAMVPLRTNMPGAPPIGVWIDFLVFLWVLIMLMISLAVFVGSWLVFTPEPEVSDRRLVLPWMPRRVSSKAVPADPSPADPSPADPSPADLKPPNEGLPPPS